MKKEIQALSEREKKERVKRSLKYSIFDGSYYAAMVGFGESFFTAFAVFLKATNFQIGLIGSLPQALGAALQIFSNRLIHIFGSRKRLVCTLALLQGLMYIPVMLTFYFAKFSVFYLILFISLYMIFGSIINPAWSSWMGDLVDENKRGSYFGKRNKITGMVSFVTFVIAGFMLQNFSDGAMMQYAGFAMLFVVAFVSRIFSFVYLFKQYEPPY
ncbi:MAG: MFS transporter, partial [Candidatus Woesearchaeota archaeon]|nr:MFS transporter [Candidatus Woesearchaeota archaeon]